MSLAQDGASSAASRAVLLVPAPAPAAASAAVATVLSTRDLLELILSWLDHNDLDSVAGVSRQFRAAARSDWLWEARCHSRWARKARRYRLTPARRRTLAGAGKSWRQLFIEHELDGARLHFSGPGELSALTFSFW